MVDLSLAVPIVSYILLLLPVLVLPSWRLVANLPTFFLQLQLGYLFPGSDTALLLSAGSVLFLSFIGRLELLIFSASRASPQSLISVLCTFTAQVRTSPLLKSLSKGLGSGAPD